MLRFGLILATSALCLHVTNAAAACGEAVASCVQLDGQAIPQVESLSAKHLKILPHSFRTTRSGSDVGQTRPLITRNGTAQVANSGRVESLLDNRFAVSNPKKAPINFYGLKKRIDNDNLIGVFMRGKLPVADALKLSGTVGFTRATFAEGGGRELANDSDVSYGLGTEFRMTEDLSLSVDYMQLIDRPQVEHSGINLGLEGRF